MRLPVWLLSAALVTWCYGARVEAQVIEARVGRFFDSTHWTTYRLGLNHRLGGSLGIQLHADVLRPAEGGSGGFAGLGTDLTAFRRGQEGPYLVAGLSGGMGSETSNSLSDVWGSWSAGVGYDVFPASFLSLGAEGRWRQLSVGRRGGFELALGLSLHLGGGGAPSYPTARPPPSTVGAEASPPTLPDGSVNDATPLADSIIATASDAMGRPYRYGGTGEDGSGFDCSGLIQFAFGKHGIVLPRRSADQAQEGRKVDRKLNLLQPADLLTFSNRGGPVTHVGLYIGNGQFIHSATRGVQVSILSPDDPYGRWWYKRWVGVRRIVR
ncbi:MAG TPA: C40 family peptidase [Gemmatimonadales bacterium]|nr:C40 family peptidase [Gemmatimonadales bacterium]